MLNAIPILGWLLSLLLSMSVAVPVWYCWTVCGLGEIYGGSLPTVWRAVPYWHIVGLVIVVSTLRATVWPTPLKSGTQVVLDALEKSRKP